VRRWPIGGAPVPPAVDPEHGTVSGEFKPFRDVPYCRGTHNNLHAPGVVLGFEVGGILGHQFLQGHRVAMDLPRGELRLQRAS
jgi:hypothetical protein